MTLLTVVQDVCAAVGVERPMSVFSNINYNRTMTEMLALANEMAQRIAYDSREWGVLKNYAAFDRSMGIDFGSPSNPSVPVQVNFPLPADFKRLLLASNVYRTSVPSLPLRFIPDYDQWLQRRLCGYFDNRGEWIVVSPTILAVAPPPSDLRTLPAWQNNTSYTVASRVKDVSDGTFWTCKVIHVSAAADTFANDRAAHLTYWQEIFQDRIIFYYLSKNCIALAGGGVGDSFINDSDNFRIDERVLKLGMIWQWKANKGSPYAEDLGTYNDALATVSGADSPAPIIVGRLPISAAARVGYPFPIDSGMVPL
jgi:hypothetical protein